MSKIAGKIKQALSKVMRNKSLILHCVLVLILIGSLAWQVLDFYSYSTNANRTKAVKTQHMVIYDVLTGETLKNLPTDLAHVEKIEQPEANNEPAQPIKEEAPEGEIAIIISAIGRDPALTSEISSLPPEFIYSFSPYFKGAMEESIKKTSAHSLIMADITTSTKGKFDISTSNNDFRNYKNIEAGISKIYQPVAIFLQPPEGYISTGAFTEIANNLDKKQVYIVLPNGGYNGTAKNVVSANIFITASTALDDVKQQLQQLEDEAKSSGYALAVVEVQPGISITLNEWAAAVKAHKFKIIPAIRN